MTESPCKTSVLIRHFRVCDLYAETWWNELTKNTLRVDVYRSKTGAYIEAKSRLRGPRPGLIQILEKFEIEPELRLSTSNVCSIGFSRKTKKWYGWSHRALVGFGIGDRIFDPNYGDNSTPFVKHGARVIETYAHARQAACAFAEDVS